MSDSRLHLRITSEADLARSVVLAAHTAKQMGLSTQDSNALSTAVSELARNILKYADHGEVIIEGVKSGTMVGVQVTVRDQGPGIPNVNEALSDHFSSGGTLGLGLPGVKRLMDDFVIDSEPGKGTRVVIRKWNQSPPRPVRSRLHEAARRASDQQRRGEDEEEGVLADDSPSDVGLDCAYFVRPCRGERVSGDIVVVERRAGQLLVAVIDALGHGPGAHAIAVKASRFLGESWTSDLEKTTRDLHEALRGTDGAAAGLCIVDVDAFRLRYVGVGNTMIRVLGDNERTIASTPGTLGSQIRTPREQRLAINGKDLVLLYTDGVKERFAIQGYPQLRYENVRTIARTIVTRYGKDHDDASCVALRYQS